MVLTESSWKYFAQIPFRIRAGLANSQSSVPFKYEDESFFTSYDVLYRIWVKRQSQRAVINSYNISGQL